VLKVDNKKEIITIYDSTLKGYKFQYLLEKEQRKEKIYKN